VDGSAKAHQHAISSFDCPLKERFAVKLELGSTPLHFMAEQG
jgi:hypothetical protein